MTLPTQSSPPWQSNAQPSTDAKSLEKLALSKLICRVIAFQKLQIALIVPLSFENVLSSSSICSLSSSFLIKKSHKSLLRVFAYKDFPLLSFQTTIRHLRKINLRLRFNCRSLNLNSSSGSQNRKFRRRLWLPWPQPRPHPPCRRPGRPWTMTPNKPLGTNMHAGGKMTEVSNCIEKAH